MKDLDPRMTGSPPVAALGHEVLVEMVTLHARVLQRMPVVQLVLVGGLGIVFYEKAGSTTYLTWAVLAIGMECLRSVVATWVLRRLDSIDPHRVHRWFIGMAAAAGFVDSLMSVLFMPRVSLLDQAWLGVVVFAIPAAGVAVSMSSRYILSAFALAVIVPACLTWAVLHPEHREAVIGLGLLYCGLLILVAAESERLLTRAVTIRRERDRVVRDLERSNQEVRAAQRRAEDSAQARARVLAAASHDLRQPLHALSIYSAILAANPSPPTLREVGVNIDQIVRSLGDLLGGLLDLSRLSTGYFTPEQQDFQLDAVVAGICHEFDSVARSKGLTLSTELAAIQVRSDPMILGRITRNLIDNAIKYTDQGKVMVHLRRGPETIVLEVADTGKGIAAHEHQHVFEEFYQIDNPGRDRSKGVGLGLALVQRMSELIGARIELESAPGSGSTFRLSLPAATSMPAPEVADTIHSDIVDLAGARIYVIDDEQDILASMKTLLGLWGANAQTANGAAAAESLFTEHGPPQLLIADLRLGEAEHGTALSQRLRQRWGEFPVLITTGETSSEALREANEAGYPLLHKPIAAKRLREAIDAALIGQR